MPHGIPGWRARLAPLLLCAAVAAGCGSSGPGVFKQQYEYEEEMYLALDGSAQVNVNASIAALVALRGAALNIDPQSRPDRDGVRAFFSGPGVEVSTPTFSRRNGRRFVHLRIDVEDLRQLPRLAPFAWSSYRFEREGGVFVYRQTVGRPAGVSVPDVGWRGTEVVAFRMHLPSEIPFNNSPKPVQRGNILEWEQPLSERLAGEPLDLQVTLESESILYSTLLLFGSTILAAAVTFALVIWWVSRRGREADAQA